MISKDLLNSGVLMKGFELEDYNFYLLWQMYKTQWYAGLRGMLRRLEEYCYSPHTKLHRSLVQQLSILSSGCYSNEFLLRKLDSILTYSYALNNVTRMALNNYISREFGHLRKANDNTILD